jgi:hypothetical protein
MKRKDRNTVKRNEVKVREIPAEEMQKVRDLVDSATKETTKALEHVER